MPSHPHAKLTLSKPLPVVRSVTSSSLIAPNGHPPFSVTDWHKADGEKKNIKLPELDGVQHFENERKSLKAEG